MGEVEHSSTGGTQWSIKRNGNRPVRLWYIIYKWGREEGGGGREKEEEERNVTMMNVLFEEEEGNSKRRGEG